MGRKLKLKGLRFGSLTVTKESGQRKSGSVLWDCVCDCGKTLSCVGRDLKSGNTKSCGCTRVQKLMKFNNTHNMSRLRVYSIYRGMLSRCYNTKDTQYKLYGGRGIIVCSDWLESFEGFYKDMGESYEEDLTLERNDVNWCYSRSNCSWVSKSEQALNKTMYSNNKSGYTGISYQERKYGLTIVATVQNPVTQKAVVKTRNLKKFDEEESLKFLLSWMEEKREEFGYKTSHGSIKQSKEI